MPETLRSEDSQASAKLAEHALTLIDKTPCWELKAPDVIYPITVDETYKGYFHFDRYPEADLRTLLQETGSRTEVDGQNFKTIPGRNDEYVTFAEAHLVAVTGCYGPDGENPPSREDILAWIQEDPDRTASIVEAGPGGIRSEKDSPGENRPLVLGVSQQGSVHRFTQKLAAETLRDGLKRREATVEFAHHLGVKTAKQRNEFRRASSRSVNRKRGELLSDTNYGIWFNLYAQLVEKVDGFRIDGVRCGPENKGDWLPLIPPWHKLRVVMAEFEAADSKNA